MALHKARTKAKDEGCDISGQYERDSSADYEKQAFGSSVFSVAWGGVRSRAAGRHSRVTCRGKATVWLVRDNSACIFLLALC